MNIAATGGLLVDELTLYLFAPCADIFSANQIAQRAAMAGRDRAAMPFRRPRGHNVRQILVCNRSAIKMHCDGFHLEMQYVGGGI